MKDESVNYYDVLEIPANSSQDIIYAAYKNAKETFSLSNPNLLSTFSETEALQWVDIIEEAFSVIGHPNTRRVYDSERQTLTVKTLPSLTLEKSKFNSSSSEPKQTPEASSQTAFSTYTVNQAMEDLIEKQDIFDGLFLKKIREYKNIDLTEFSKHTCIAIRHLYAIENNNFSVLPASVFIRGYIIQYCKVLNLEQERVVPSFMSLLKNG